MGRWKIIQNFSSLPFEFIFLYIILEVFLMEHNNQEKNVLFLNKLSIFFSVAVLVVTYLFLICIVCVDSSLFTAEMLEKITEINRSIILALSAIAIAVFQFGSKATEEGKKEKQKKLHYIQKYLFFTIPLLIFGVLSFLIVESSQKYVDFMPLVPALSIGMISITAFFPVYVMNLFIEFFGFESSNQTKKILRVIYGISFIITIFSMFRVYFG